MQKTVELFGIAVAEAVLAQEWNAVHSFLAPWLQNTLDVNGVRDFFEDAYRTILEGNGISEIHYPAVPYVSGNSSDLAFLRVKKDFMPAPRAIAQEVTDDNFRQWMSIQLQCSEEQAEELELDYLCEIWVIVVEEAGKLQVGYWSHSAY